jgi:threonine 3-dehydrogenase
VITHRLPYQEYEDGFSLMKSGHSGKIILDWAKPEGIHEEA